MLTLAAAVEIYLYRGPADMRRGFDGLMRTAEEHLERNVLDGGLFVFINRRRDRLKLLWWDNDGLALFYKRLEAGTYELPAVDNDTAYVILSPTELSMLLGGIELASAKRRKRFRRASANAA